MGCSWALYIGQGRLAGAAEERSWWRPVEFNGAVVLSLESALRGRGNGGVAPLRKGKWSWHGLGHRGGARCDGSRPDGRRRLGRPREGDEGGAGWVNQKGRTLVGPAWYGERKRGGLHHGLGRKRFWAALRKRKRFSDFDSMNNIQI
jgi:hypothetical protein